MKDRRRLIRDGVLLLGFGLAIARCLLPGGSGEALGGQGPRSEGQVWLSSVVGEGIEAFSVGSESTRAHLRAWRITPAWRKLGGARVGPPVGISIRNVHVAWAEGQPGEIQLFAKRAVWSEKPGLVFEECALQLREPQPVFLFSDKIHWRRPDQLLVPGGYRVGGRRAPRRRGDVSVPLPGGR